MDITSNTRAAPQATTRDLLRDLQNDVFSWKLSKLASDMQAMSDEPTRAGTGLSTLTGGR